LRRNPFTGIPLGVLFMQPDKYFNYRKKLLNNGDYQSFENEAGKAQAFVAKDWLIYVHLSG
jgi:hypothetical protein